MNIHHSHTLTRDGHNGLCDPWHRCATCGETDAGLAEPCNPDAGLGELLRTIDAADNAAAESAAARIEDLEAQVAELREAARGQIVVVEMARKVRRDAERVIEFVARTATDARLIYAERVSLIANHPYVSAFVKSGEGRNG